MAAAAGGLPVQVETRASSTASFGKGTRTTLPLKEALTRMAASDGRLYLSAQPPPRPGPGNLPLPAGPLALALATPSPTAPAGLIPLRPACAAGLIPAAVNVWVGGGAGGSGLHADAHDNLLTLVAGKKAVTLFPPSTVGEMATAGTPLRVWPNGRLVFAGPGEDAEADGASPAALLEAAARAAQRAAVESLGEGAGTDEEEEAALEAALAGGVDDFEEEDEEEDARDNGGHPAPSTPPTFSRADLAHPASVRAAYPSFPWRLGGTATLSPGQTLFIPAGWFHFVRSEPEPAGRPAAASPWAGLHCAVNHWFHPPDAAATGGPAAPYSRPYWAGVWEEALASCEGLRVAVAAQERAASAAVRPPPTPSQALQAHPRASPSTDIAAARALLRQGPTGLASFDAGGRRRLRRARQATLLQALSGRRTRHGAQGVLAWARKQRR